MKEKPEKEEQNPVAEKKKGLQYPLPDPVSEGDLMVHGHQCFDRVRDLHKIKLEKDEDKMILAHGRQYLTKVQKFLEENADFKIMPELCHDLIALNSSDRWKIEVPKSNQRGNFLSVLCSILTFGQKCVKRREAPLVTNAAGTETTTVQPTSQGPSSERPSSEQPSSEQPSSEQPSSVQPTSTQQPSSEQPSTVQPSSEQPTDQPQITTPEKPKYEEIRRQYYRLMGNNFGRLLMKEFRKEELIKEETDYLAHWIADESVHLGTAMIYCKEGEDVKEIKKRLDEFLVINENQ